jgi:hypothetical protein
MNTITRRIAATAALLVAPALIALGTASASYAETTTNHSNMVHAPTEHKAFPDQNNTPKPGTPEHHHHQKMHAK